MVNEIKNYGATSLPREFLVESTDVKPTTLSNGDPLPVGSTAWEKDSKTGFIFDGVEWWEV